MPRGKVITFSGPKGFGFIEQGPGEPDIFVHFSGIQGDGYKRLNQGDLVEYEVGFGPKGKPQAGNVRVVEKAQVGHGG